MSFYNFFEKIHFYLPQRSCGKVIFSQASVSHSAHKGVYPNLHWGKHPPPPGQGVMLCFYTFLSVILFTGVCAWSRGGGCLVETPRDGYCCGRFASYLNAFLFNFLSKIHNLNLKKAHFQSQHPPPLPNHLYSIYLYPYYSYKI